MGSGLRQWGMRRCRYGWHHIERSPGEEKLSFNPRQLLLINMHWTFLGFSWHENPSRNFPKKAINGRPGHFMLCVTFYSNQIGLISLGGTVTEFPVPTSGNNPLGITARSDGNLWFTEDHGNKIGRITSGGTITEFPLPTSGSSPVGITAGSDGNLWFTEANGNKIGRISPSGAIIEFPVPTSGSNPHEITAGPDGNLWFTEANGNKIGRITSDK